MLTVSPEHILHYLICSEDIARLSPVLGAHLDDEKGNGYPEKYVEALEGAVGCILVFPVKG